MNYVSKEKIGKEGHTDIDDEKKGKTVKKRSNLLFLQSHCHKLVKEYKKKETLSYRIREREEEKREKEYSSVGQILYGKEIQKHKNEHGTQKKRRCFGF